VRGQFIAQETVDQGGRFRRSVAAADREGGPAAEVADQPRAQHDHGKRDVEEEYPHEGCSGETLHDPVFQCPLADAHDGLDHDGEHCRLEAEEQRRHETHVTEGRVDVAERHDGDDAGQDEQAAGHDPASGTMHQPADIGRKLLRLRTRKQHAVIQRVLEPVLGDPILLLHQDPVHHRDLTGGTAETQHRHAKPDPKGLAYGRHASRRQRGGNRRVVRGDIGHARAPTFAFVFGLA
jgi:hypothetical protein